MSDTEDRDHRAVEAESGTMSEMLAPKEPPFGTPEYNRSFQRFLHDAMDALAKSKDPLLQRMKQKAPSRTYVGRNSLPGGAVIEGATMPVRTTFSLSANEMLSGDVSVFAKKVDAMASEYVASLMPQVFAGMSSSIEAVGNRVDAGGEPLSADLIIELLEKMQIEFNEEGVAHLTLVVNPASVPQLTSDEERRINDAIERKRQQYFAERRTRQLPQHPLGA